MTAADELGQEGDDAEAVQAAIDAAQDVVVLPPRAYIVRRLLTIPHDLILQGG